MKKLELRQMEIFSGGRICEENPLSTELQMLMCQIQAEEELNYVFVPIGPDNAMYWLDRMFSGRWY